MMDWTERHCRQFHRAISGRALLYTEMVTDRAVIHGDRDRLLGFDPVEHPVAVQLGGSDPRLLAEAARIAADRGYDEVNLNCGCPSDRVQSGCFGAVMMETPGLVADCVAAMIAAVDVPVTVKCRIGVDDQRPEEALPRFIETVSAAGVTQFTIHARKAWLQGLSPKENREVPPLRYDVLQRLTRDFPGFPMVLNGGLRDAPAALAALQWCDGVMLGREAYHRPYVLAELQEALHPGSPRPTRAEVLERMAAYAERELARGERFAAITRHMLGLFTGQPGAREYRRVLSEGARRPDAGPDILRAAARAAIAAAA
jgi:tRNA-dihydrouridine synthase A